ncbi:30S ribosomal protein S17 [Candidatus Gottesmanbacteria bacterium]|nr:30S ribosomal protein S17 [Candidatus Gottesmanbacteria bacterium]
MKALVGKIVSIKMEKTVVIERIVWRTHPLYKKKMKKDRRIKAHAEMPLAVGDTVKFTATRPLSKEKHYKVIEKIT